jgi:ribonucleoside-diphosphate reductase alpha chain
MLSHGIEIDPTRDSNFTEDGLNLLKKFYSADKGETAQVALARTCNNFSYGDEALAQRLYNAASKQWWFPSSPPLSNAVEGEWNDTWLNHPNFWRPENKEMRKSSWVGKAPKALNISCFLVHLGDSIKSQMLASSELKMLSVMGGGTSLQSRVRATTDVAPGPIPFIKTVDGDMGYWRQGKNRRGSCAVYLDVDHPDIMEFIKMRTPSGGDANRKIVNRSGVHHGVNFTKKFANAVLDDEMFDLVCPHTKEVRDTVRARVIWEAWLDARELTGEPYFYNIDNANEQLNPYQKARGLRNWGSNLCSEITLPNNDDRTAICCLSSLNLEKYDEWKNTDLVQDLIRFLDNNLQWFIDWAPEDVKRAVFSAAQERAVGLGGMGWANLLLNRGIGFESNEAIELNKEVWKLIKEKANEETKRLASERGEPNDLIGSGTRNSCLLAVAPNANSSILCGTSPSIEPLMSNAYTQKTRAGIMLVKNKYLVPVLDRLGINTQETWMKIANASGSVQWIEGLTGQERQVFKTAWEVDQHVIIQQAEDRQKYVCQAQSLNVFFLPGSDKSYINSVHLKALVSDVLKSMYYFRTGSATAVQNVQEQARVALQDFKVEDKPDEDCVACQA